MADTDGFSRHVTRDRLLLALVLLVGIAGTGIVRRQLGVLGYNWLGRLVFIFGYGGTVFVVWYGWIRPLDLTGPDGGTDLYADGDRSEDRPGDRVDESE
ncbi:hypothetical protein [Halobaculum sp. D14]|uniref:hypothetical protein n=1 Tax=unclassified Halobaculum TaxID=2640896 RepID=UPI003EBE2A86